MNSEAIAQIAHETTPVNARRVSMTPSQFLGFVRCAFLNIRSSVSATNPHHCRASYTLLLCLLCLALRKACHPATCTARHGVRSHPVPAAATAVQGTDD